MAAIMELDYHLCNVLQVSGEGLQPGEASRHDRPQVASGSRRHDDAEPRWHVPCRNPEDVRSPRVHAPGALPFVTKSTMMKKRPFGVHVLDSSTDRLVSPVSYSNQQIAIKLAIVIYIDWSIAYAALLK